MYDKLEEYELVQFAREGIHIMRSSYRAEEKQNIDEWGEEPHVTAEELRIPSPKNYRRYLEQQRDYKELADALRISQADENLIAFYNRASYGFKIKAQKMATRINLKDL